MADVTFTLEAETIEVNQLLKLVGLCDSGGAGTIDSRGSRKQKKAPDFRQRRNM